ncbi:MAG: glycosyltransferase family 2 protein [Bacteroidales bacterium]|nr:glycosyltransferase family 2 protein [Bacteroidales bacterium]
MEQGKKKISVIVVTFKGKHWYDQCFTSLRNSALPVQTIVVDNASNDGSVEYIKERFPEIHLVESKDNLGFGQANNLAMRYALDQGCDYMFLLNQDAWVETDTLEKLVGIHNRHPEYGILGPVQVNAEKTKVLDGVIQFLINPDNVNRQMFSDFMMGTIDEVYPVAEINAAAWLIPRNTLETVGGFDPIFLHYGEDWNYLSRVLYHGMKVGLTPHIQVVHDCLEQVDRPKGYEMDFDKWLLLRATDILYPDTQVEDMIRQYRRTAIMKLLTFHKATFKENWEAYRFLKRNRTCIEYSRNKNKTVGANWL